MLVKIQSVGEGKDENLHLGKEKDAGQAQTNFLRLALHYVILAADGAHVVQFVSNRRSSALAYPTVDFIFDEEPVKEIKETALVNLLMNATKFKTNRHQNISEVAVERLVGAALAAFFRALKSGQKLHVPDLLRQTKGSTFPGVGGAIRVEEKTTYIEPIVITGEKRMYERGLGEDDQSDPTKPNSRARLAAAIHPTLSSSLPITWRTISPSALNLTSAKISLFSMKKQCCTGYTMNRTFTFLWWFPKTAVSLSVFFSCRWLLTIPLASN
ncbi:hypothetical protein C8R45DRAFT_1070667 [Mycena sanguinolenta]|nr:hypothetical protein C8R45DRAFT_1070667 [Mycena sanguinolenta]